MTLHGRVRYWNRESGYGFIREHGAGRDESADDVFFRTEHVTGIAECDIKGADVICHWEQSSRGPRATMVRPEAA